MSCIIIQCVLPWLPAVPAELMSAIVVIDIDFSTIQSMF